VIQCEGCEFYDRALDGAPILRCDPFSTIKEPECLAKWQLVNLKSMVDGYQATLAMYRRLAPLQEKMMRHMEREIDEAEDADSWKQGLSDDDDNDEDTSDSW
jgi:hypothetical protein